MMTIVMPRLSTFYGIIIYMYVRDHGTPHIHAVYGSDRAVVDVTTGQLLAGRLGPRQAGLVRDWIRMHRAELLQAWEHASAGEAPGTIEPLP